MCVEFDELRTEEARKKGIIHGYKVLSRHDTGLFTFTKYFKHQRGWTVDPNASKNFEDYHNFQKDRFGFHFFTIKNQAEKWKCPSEKIVRVLAFGVDVIAADHRSVAVKEIFIGSQQC